jgi:hypothetical protein
MIEVTQFAGQNWLITPAALAVNQRPPPNILGQKWLLVFSGVAISNVSGSDYPPPVETLHITPDIPAPLHYAIDHYAIPRPPGNENFQYLVQFQVENWSPFVAMSEISDQDSDVNMCSVDRWRPSPFKTGTDAFINAVLGNIFDGIIADVRVMPEAAWMQRVSYNITLLGWIVFTNIIIT